MLSYVAVSARRHKVAERVGAQLAPLDLVVDLQILQRPALPASALTAVEQIKDAAFPPSFVPQVDIVDRPAGHPSPRRKVAAPVQQIMDLDRNSAAKLASGDSDGHPSRVVESKAYIVSDPSCRTTRRVGSRGIYAMSGSLVGVGESGMLARFRRAGMQSGQPSEPKRSHKLTRQHLTGRVNSKVRVAKKVGYANVA